MIMSILNSIVLTILYLLFNVAVDAHVGKHLFEVCILDYLVRQRRKCVVLVTNQLQVSLPLIALVR